MSLPSLRIQSPPPARASASVIRACGLGALVSSLVGCSPASRAPAAAPAPAPTATATSQREAPLPAVHVTFEARTREPWTLREQDGSFVCNLPCSYWVPADSGLQLRNERHAYLADAPQLVPAHLPAHPGARLRARVDREHAGGGYMKGIAGTAAGTFGLFGGIITAVSVASLASGSKGSSMTTDVCAGVGVRSASASACARNETRGVAADVGGLALGTGLLGVAALSTYWLFHARSAGVDFDSPRGARSATRLRLHPGFVEVSRGRKRSLWTAGGVQGVF